MLFKFAFERFKQKSPLLRGSLQVRCRSAAKPGIYSGSAVLFFPGFQAAVVAAFGLDQFAGVRVLVNLDHACATLFWCGGDRCGLAWVRVKDGNDIAQALAIALHQRLQLFFEFDFFLQASVVLQGFQLGKLLLKGFFCCAKFGDDGGYEYRYRLAFRRT